MLCFAFLSRRPSEGEGEQVFTAVCAADPGPWSDRCSAHFALLARLQLSPCMDAKGGSSFSASARETWSAEGVRRHQRRAGGFLQRGEERLPTVRQRLALQGVGEGEREERGVGRAALEGGAASSAACVGYSSGSSLLALSHLCLSADAAPSSLTPGGPVPQAGTLGWAAVPFSSA